MHFTHLDDDLFSLLAWAAMAHGKQPYGHNDYWIHLVAVLCVALENGVTDKDTLMACVCHDLLEDTRIQPEELAAATSEAVFKIVQQCTFNHPTRREQLEAIARASLTMTPRAMIVKCCDTMANMASLGSGLGPQEVLDHKWMKTLPYRLRFVQNYLDRIDAIGRPLRSAETQASVLCARIKAKLRELGVPDGK